MIAKAGGKKTSLLPKGVGKKTKYPLNFVSFRTLYSAGQVGGIRSYLKKFLVMSKRNSDFGGEET